MVEEELNQDYILRSLSFDGSYYLGAPAYYCQTLGKMDLKDVASNAKQRTARKVLALRRFIHENEEVARKNWKNFRHEINEAYSDLQKVLH